ncbi:MAG: aminopeptidase [Candidatus Woesearchaeota archaeon]
MYEPSKEILDNYADILVNFALNSGKGVSKGDVVQIQVPECAKPMLIALRRAVLKAGAHPIIQYLPDDISREYFELANDDQLSFFPEKYLRGIVDQVDHTVAIIADTNKHELDGVPPSKIMLRQKNYKPYMDWRQEKENKGKYTWTLGLYGTPAMAKEVGMSLEEYWEQIIRACYLDEQNPVQKWKDLTNNLEEIKEKLNALEIEKLHIEAKDTDIFVQIGPNRKWLGGSGRNIPSFELFISPDWRGTNGHIQFTEPLYRYGSLITDVYLEFKDGIVTKARASKNEDLLKEMISAENADKIGEFSLTDSRFSRITKFMGETLYDENVGGKNGNTHLAVGMAYKDSYTGDPSTVVEEKWKEMGFNDSVVHTDIVATSNRKVTAYLKDGSTKVIYKDGQFLV